jgi:hypothetical protein
MQKLLPLLIALFTCNIGYSQLTLTLSSTMPSNISVCDINSGFNVGIAGTVPSTTFSISMQPFVVDAIVNGNIISINQPFPNCINSNMPPGNDVNPISLLSPIEGLPLDFELSSFEFANDIYTWDFLYTGSNPAPYSIELSFTFDLFIDCALIPGNYSQLFLLQNWSYNAPSTSTGNIFANQPPPVPIYYPHIIDGITSGFIPFDTYYGQDLDMTFKYHNNGDGGVNMAIKFEDLYKDACGIIPEATGYTFVSLSYAAAPFGFTPPPASFTPFSLGIVKPNVFVDAGEVLHILYIVNMNECRECDDEAREVKFTWKCSDAPNNDFCPSCMEEIVTQFELLHKDPIFTVKRNTPTYNIASYDNSCPGETEEWEIEVENTGNATINELNLSLFNSAFPNNLTVISEASVTYTNCVGCTLNVTPQKGPSTCNKYADEISSYNFQIENMEPGQIFKFKFETYRCCTDKPILFGAPKIYNNWQIAAACTTECNKTVGASSLPNTQDNAGAFGLGHISSGAVIDQKIDPPFNPGVTHLTYFPTPTDIVAPFSQQYHIQVNGFFGSPTSMQLLGHNSSVPPTDPPKLSGIIRAVIECETGLIVDDLANDAFFELRFKDLSIPPVFWTPFAYHEGNVNATQNERCEKDEYYFYFDLEDVPAALRLAFLDTSRFVFRLTPCCGANAEPTNYNVSFSLMMNKDDCFSMSIPTPPAEPVCTTTIPGSCCWLPLSSAGYHVNVHCPGCKAPGAIVDNYYLRRTSYGYEDTNNNKFADAGLNTIDPHNYNYLLAGSNIPYEIDTNRSVYGDFLEDRLVAHFQDGDNSGTDPGYTYGMMLDQIPSITLGFLQLLVTIPHSNDSEMDLTVEGFDFYIDDGIPSTSGNCIDCGAFSGAFTYNTLLHVAVTPDGLNNFLVRDQNNYFYTFSEAVLSSQVPVLGVSYTSHNTGFSSYQVDQQYRLTVRYKICGNIYSTNLYYPVLSDLYKPADITTKMWFIGDPIDPNKPKAPNTQPELASSPHNISFDPTNYPGTTLVNQQNLANAFQFYCETYGWLHQFYSTDFINQSFYSSAGNNLNCEKKISTNAVSSFYRRKSSIFPYEYKTPGYIANEFKIIVPEGYRLSTTKNPVVYSRYPISNNTSQDQYTPSQEFSLANCTTCVTSTTPCTLSFYLDDIKNSLIPPLPVGVDFITCLEDQATLPGLGLYMGDEYTHINVDVFLEACECVPLIYEADAKEVKITFENNNTCIPVNYCGSDVASFNMEYPRSWYKPNPNLSIVILPPVVNASTQTVTWDYIIYNENVINTPAFTAASYVYFNMPDNIQYLDDWNIIVAGNSITPNGNIFGLAANLNLNTQLTGSIKAKYDPCQGDATLSFQWGWNCQGFPTFAPGEVICEINTATLSILDRPANLVVDHSKTTYPPFLVLCSGNNSISACFKSNLQGTVLPESFMITNFDPLLLQIDDVIIKNCNTGNGPPPLGPVTSHTFTTSELNAAGIADPDGYMTVEECICIEVIFTPLCQFTTAIPLPSVIVNAVSYCGNPIIAVKDFDPVNANTSICTDCYSVTKTVNVSEILVNFPVVFTIEVCGNNSSNTQPLLTDNLPSNFITTSNPLSTPQTVNLQSSGLSCVTYQIVGSFTHSGNYCNEAVLSNLPQPNLTAQACVDAICTEFDIQTFQEDVISDIMTVNSLTNHIKDLTFLVNDMLIIDVDVKFERCIFFMETGAHIKIQGQTFEAYASEFYACNDMWRGIYAETGSKVILAKSTINHAETGVHFDYGTSYFEINSSAFQDCVTGIYAAPDLNSPNNLNPLNGVITHTSFETVNGLIKDPYAGQTPFGAIGKVGIEAHRVIWTIGDDNSPANTFENLNMGILLHKSRVHVRNSEFKNIHVDPGYPMLPYNGSAIISLGNRPISSYLSVIKPVSQSQDIIIEDAEYGIYTSLSSSDIQNVRMKNVTTGMYTEYSKNNYTEVINCTIEASNYGLFWRNNAYAKYMKARQNTIIVDSKGTGIFAGESNLVFNYFDYEIIKNNVKLSGGSFGPYPFGGNAGISLWNIGKPIVFDNTIALMPTSSAGSKATGIMIDGCLDARIECNDITGGWPSSVLTKGIQVRESDRSNISCNIVDNTWRGIAFLGSSPDSRVRGNNFFEHFEGLFVDGAGVIGTQERHGNIWSYATPPNGWQARNDNTNQGGVQASEFLVTQNPGTPYYPTQINTSGWFQPDQGATFDCNGWTDDNGLAHSALCGNYDPDDGNPDEDLDLKIAIANDMLETVDWEDESKAKARLYLYNYLKQNPDVAESRQEFMDFMDLYDETVINAQWEVDNELRNIEQYNEIFAIQIEAAYNLIGMYTDSINYIYEHDLQDFYANELEAMYYQIGFLEQTIYNLQIQRQIYVEGVLDNAEFLNDYIVSSELPYQNNQTVTEIYMEYLEEEYSSDEVNYRPDAIVNNYSQLLSIAHQCPAAGGKAVFQARVMLSLINDSIHYDDDNACLLAGIYREIPTEAANFNYELIPNPAKDQVTLRILNEQEGFCHIEITNILGKIVFTSKVDCGKGEHVIPTYQLMPGTYLVKVKFEDFEKVEKLLIIR